MKQNGKIKENAGPVDKLISVITYIVFALFSLICRQHRFPLQER